MRSSDSHRGGTNEEWLKLALQASNMCAYNWDLRTNEIKRSSDSDFFADLDPAEGTWSYLQALNHIHPDDRANVMDAVRQAIESKEQFSVEYRVIDGDRLRWFQSRGQVLCDEHGRPENLISVAAEITAEKQGEAKLRQQTQELELAKERLKFTLDAAGMVPILGASPEGFRSAGLCRMLGIEDENTLLNRENILGYCHPDDRDRMVRDLNEADETQMPIQNEFRFRRSDGEYRWFLTKGIHRAEGEDGIVRGYVIVQDIHARKQAEALLQQKSEELAAINAKLARFSGVVAHDLKGPLNTILMATELLDESSPAATVHEASEFIQRGVRRMVDLIDDLLQFAKLDSGTELKLESVSLQSVVENVQSNLKAGLTSSHAELRVNSPLPTVTGHPTLLLQLLQNLVGNALKFRSAVDPLIQISADGLEDSWQISVSDNGVGIAPEKQEIIFEPFQRGDARAVDGVGLGLSICKKIVEVHGGKIWIESKVGVGTTFHFTIGRADSASSL